MSMPIKEMQLTVLYILLIYYFNGTVHMFDTTCCFVSRHHHHHPQSSGICVSYLQIIVSRNVHGGRVRNYVFIDSIDARGDAR